MITDPVAWVFMALIAVYAGMEGESMPKMKKGRLRSVKYIRDDIWEAVRDISYRRGMTVAEWVERQLLVALRRNHYKLED